MADCPLLKTCIFFNDQMIGMPSTAEVIKYRYCRGDNSECARFMVFRELGRDAVPKDLFPNQIDTARSIVSGQTESSSGNA